MKTQRPLFVRHGKLLLLCAAAIVLFLAMFVIRGRMERNLRTFHQLYQDLTHYQQAGQMLRQGSDLLTDAVRRHAVSDALDARAARDAYFHEANVEKHRDRALAMLDTLPGGAEVKQNLATAMDYSLELMDIEYHAMRLVATPEELASPDCPEPVGEYLLPEHEENLPREQQLKRAQELLFGGTYEHFKTQIYHFIDQSFAQATRNLEDRYAKTVAYQKKLYLLLGLDMLALLAVVVAVILHLYAQRARATSLLRKLLDNMPLLFFVKNARTGCYLDANAAFLQFAGKPQLDDLLGKDDYAIFDKHTAKNLTDNDAKTLLSRKPVTLIDTLTDTAGTQRRYRLTQFVIDGAAGAPCVFGMGADITASEEVSANAAALAKLLMCLQDDEVDVHPAQLLQIVRERTDADFALLVRYDQQGLCLIEEGSGIDRRNAAISRAVSCPTAAIPQILDAIQRQKCFAFSPDDLAALRTACLAHGGDRNALPECTSMFAVPIFVHHELWGNLSIAYKVPHRMSTHEREFCRECCEILAVVIERRINYRKLQAAAQQTAPNAPKA